MTSKQMVINDPASAVVSSIPIVSTNQIQEQLLILLALNYDNRKLV